MMAAYTSHDLSEELGTTPEFWVNLQQTWDLARAYQEREAS